MPTTTETQDETTTVTGAMSTVEMTTAESETITNTGELTSTVSGTQDEMTAAESDAPNLPVSFFNMQTRTSHVL